MSDTRNVFRPAEYFKPASVVEVVRLLNKYGERARIIAGGTDVLVERDSHTEVLIDTTDLGLDYVKSDAGRVKIGAGTTFANIIGSSVLAKSPYDVLAYAARQIGTPQIRNVATIGGNICSAVPSADCVPPLLVLNATLRVVGPAGEKSIDINNFFRGPRENALMTGELLTEILLPNLPGCTQAVFVKKGRVATGDLSIVNAAICLTMGDGICQDVRIALGAVAPIPLRVRQAEAMLQGRKPDAMLLADVANQASKETKPISDIRSSADYRRTLSRIVVERALNEAVSILLSKNRE